MKLFSVVKQTLFLAGHGESVHSSEVSRPLQLSDKLLRWLKILVVLGVKLSLYNLLCHTMPPLSILQRKKSKTITDSLCYSACQEMTGLRLPPPLHPLRQPKEAKTSVCHWIGHKRSKKMMTAKHTVIADMSYKIYKSVAIFLEVYLEKYHLYAHFFFFSD